MKKIFSNKFISLFIAVCMLCALLPCNISAVPMDETLRDDENLAFLEALDIMSYETLPLLTDSVSRSEFVRAAVKISGIDAQSYKNEAESEIPFTDVYTDKEYIYAAYKNGFVSTAADGKFNPSAPVTMAQAAKILIEIMGYGPYAQARGGFPNGYLRVAMETELFDGCKNESQDAISYKALYRMLRNALTSVIYEINGVSTNDSLTYSNSGGETLLSRYFDIYYIEGIVNADAYTALTYKIGAEDGKIKIADTVFIDGCNAKDKLGRKVEAYYKKTDDDAFGTVIYAEDAQVNNLWHIDAADIEDGATTTSKLVYTNEKGKTQEIKLKSTVRLIYNSRFEELTKARITPSKGKVTLIDNNGDNSVDVLIVENYNKTLWVNGVGAKGNISDKLSSYVLSLDDENDDYDFEITKGGKEISVSEILPGDVLVAALPDTTTNYYNIKVIVNSQFEEGILTSYDADGSAWINEKEFKASSAFLSKVKLGDEGAFYYDAFGEIVALDKYRTVVYGYLYKMGTQGLSNVQAKIFTENNRWVTVNFEKKINFNGTSNYLPKDLFTNDLIYPIVEGVRTIKPQLIAYRVNDDREITYMQTAFDDTAAVLGTLSAAQSQNLFRLSKKYTDTQYYNTYTQSMRDGTFSLDKGVKIFMLPTAGENFEEEIMICDTSTLVDGEKYTNINIYNQTVTGLTQLVTMDKNTSAAPGLGMLVVKDVLYGTNKATGNEGYILRGWQNGTLVDLPTDGFTISIDRADFAVTDLAAGDVIQYELSRDSAIKKIFVKFDSSNTSDGVKATYANTQTSLYLGNNFVSGTVKNVDFKTQSFVIEYSEGMATSLASLKKSDLSLDVFRFDSEEETFTTASFGEIAPGSKVFVTLNYLRPRTVVVYD